ncbi:hypothetical protein SVIO_025900 [Streptomyces violaceusniger]|uniref:Uncharacterized protein n=1 Tax=Streptomyces violaceusniger TaxID=68280 RepID=A0A4D4KZN7_STRVO|nr:hypothetical protein SVIO_025900 [Streptomyces violaceusniger]
MAQTLLKMDGAAGVRVEPDAVPAAEGGRPDAQVDNDVDDVEEFPESGFGVVGATKAPRSSRNTSGVNS